MRMKRGSVKTLASWYFDAVLGGIHCNAHATEIFSNGGNPVCFLDAQFSSITDAQPILADSAKHGQNRNFIDNSGCRCAFDDTSFYTRGFHLQSANQFTVYFLDVQGLNGRAHTA